MIKFSNLFRQQPYKLCNHDLYIRIIIFIHIDTTQSTGHDYLRKTNWTKIQTRHSENDNTPQPLDQWKNSPFIGQQIGNCKFHIYPLLGRSICQAPWPNPIVHRTSYPTHIPFITSESTLPFLGYSNFNILPWKFKVKVMGEVKVWSHKVSLTFYWLTSLLFIYLLWIFMGHTRISFTTMIHCAEPKLNLEHG